MLRQMWAHLRMHSYDGANRLEYQDRNYELPVDGKSSKISLINLHTHHHHDCRVLSLILECAHAHVSEMPLAFIYPSNWLICCDLFKWRMDKLPRTKNRWIKTSNRITNHEIAIKVRE